MKIYTAEEINKEYEERKAPDVHFTCFMDENFVRLRDLNAKIDEQIEFYHRFEEGFNLKKFLDNPDAWDDFDKGLLSIKQKLKEDKK